jgi:diacylglycerol kinase (ATP)
MKLAAQITLKLLSATRYSLDGLKVLWLKEQSFRLEAYLALIAVPTAIYMHIPGILKLLLILLLMLMLLVETINSALEAIVDRISLEIHAQSKIAKDMGSAAVSIVVLMNMLAWIYAVYLVIWLK